MDFRLEEEKAYQKGLKATSNLSYKRRKSAVNKEIVVNEEITTSKLLGMSLLICIIFMADLLYFVFPRDYFIFGRIVHLFIWGIGFWYVLNWTKKKDILEDLFNFNCKTSILLIIAIIIVHFTKSFVLFQTLSPQILRQYSNLVSEFGNLEGNIAFLLRIVYYIFESLLTLFILSFFQMAGEKKFRYTYIPWGGLGVALTWGVLHFTSIEEAVYAAIMSTIIGIVYILGKKTFIPAFLMTFLLFMI